MDWIVKSMEPAGRRIGGYGILWGAPDAKDLTGEFFTPQTADLTAIFAAVGKLPVLYHHALDKAVQTEVIGYVDVLRADETGLWAEAQLNLHGKYRQAVIDLVEKGALAWSSGCLPQGKALAAGGEIRRWPIIELSLTPTPAEHRMIQQPIQTIKSYYAEIGVNARSVDFGVTQGGAMTLKEQLAQAIANAKAAIEQGDIEAGQVHRQQAEGIKAAIDEMARLEALALPAEPMRPPMPGMGSGANAPAPTPVTPPTGNEDALKAFHAVYTMRFGDEDAAVKAVFTDLLGRDYRQRVFDQYTAFAAYLRSGEGALSREQGQLLRQQIFAPSQIKAMMHDGYDFGTIKTTMVEAQGNLGGFAVPPNVQQEIITRLPGMTAIRGGGARVIDLVNANSIEAPEYTGGNERYRGGLRGVWGSETQTPAEKNATVGLKTIIANLYTYKVSMSQTLVEDAANLVDLVTIDILDTASIDEDEAFLIGNGVGRPHGLLPGSANAHSLTEVISGSNSTLTSNGLKALKRGVQSQYRRNLSFIGNSDAFGVIEQLTVSGTGSDWVFDLDDGELLGGQVRESEAMPDIAQNAFPLIAGDLSGYWIVQRAGLTLVRFQDSNTGINKVEYHVRRRVGGYPAEPWKFAVQKVSAS